MKMKRIKQIYEKHGITPFLGFVFCVILLILHTNARISFKRQINAFERDYERRAACINYRIQEIDRHIGIYEFELIELIRDINEIDSIRESGGRTDISPNDLISNFNKRFRTSGRYDLSPCDF